MDRYPSIGDHGLIGDLQAGALVTTDGTVDWFCCPRFDSPSVFCLPGHARVSIHVPPTLGGRTASIIRLVPGISAIALLAFGLHE
jgi:GH15 family glucan-1,4-alpha-glucosidase